MRIGINASFLRKPGTGIGQVTVHFLKKLTLSANSDQTTFILYTEEPVDMELPVNFTVRSFLPQYWQRDDLIRKMLWERQVAKEAEKDGCDAFLSLYQSSTAFQKSSMFHTMVVHDIIPELFPEYRGNFRQRYTWHRVKQGIRSADAIVAVSEATKHDLVEFVIKKERVSVASPDVAPVFRESYDEVAGKAILDTYHLSPGYIYHGGGLEIRKNTTGLLCAYRKLKEKSDPHVLPKLVISGKIHAVGNTLATPVKQLLYDFDLEHEVLLLDFVPEAHLPALYRNALFFAYPSRYEGFGLPVLEAMTQGIPVLTADNSSLPEVAGPAALYVEAENDESIASGLERLIHDETLRSQLSIAGPAASTRFRWDTFVDTVLKITMTSR